MACAMPVFMFFALGYEHAVVNMFVIPTGMLLGANVSFSDWWLSNQLIVTAGNIVGGLLFTGLPLYYSLRKTAPTANKHPPDKPASGPECRRHRSNSPLPKR